MIDKLFWVNVAEKWCKNDDGIVIPEIVEVENLDINELDSAINEELEDILADIEIDL